MVRDRPGCGLDALARGYATYGPLGRPGGLPAATAAAWAANVTWVLGLGLFPLVLLVFPDATCRRAAGARSHG